ncbi:MULTISPECIES: DUF6457 domain-containing protein [unclassified Arthrobacter]|uniref:DUF6457 domain-containing protein n=1 Tax=unclassified Arthrobacter TaxID=235627 RepID=UPI001E48733C|nr:MULTISPECIES: DUF6457 domain-containing protein [unclassified Arthrobacter]MCC9178443.1 DUF6457 domain-containing protein [Arthrobacter sp. zg-Y750]MDK1328163.1 DUF6457 domain-containing protein [Arthrobacter sp. zg-Y1143]
MPSQQEQLEAWSGRLLKALELEGTPVDISAVLDLAAAAAHNVVRPAAPLTTFIAGYAAGLAAGSGQATDAASMRSAMAVAAAECRDAADEGDAQ